MGQLCLLLSRESLLFSRVNYPFPLCLFLSPSTSASIFCLFISYSMPSAPLEQINLLCAENLVSGCPELTLRLSTTSSLQALGWQTCPLCPTASGWFEANSY